MTHKYSKYRTRPQFPIRPQFGALGSIVVELQKLQQALPATSGNTTRQGGRRRQQKDQSNNVEVVYDPNKKWIWQAYAFIAFFFVLALVFTDSSDPLFLALVVSLALLTVVFAVLSKFTRLTLKKGILIQNDIFQVKKIGVKDIKLIEIASYGSFGGATYISGGKRIVINHAFFDEETRKELVGDLLKVNPEISMQ